MSTSSKMLVSAIGAAVLVASPAAAKPRAHHHTVPQPAYAGQTDYGAVQHYGAVPHYRTVPTARYNEMTIIGPDGYPAGTDPDPRIRADLRRGGGGTPSAAGSSSPGH